MKRKLSTSGALFWCKKNNATIQFLESGLVEVSLWESVEGWLLVQRKSWLDAVTQAARKLERIRDKVRRWQETKP